MSRSQMTSQSHLPGVQHCTRCGTDLPLAAIFCGKCGTRVEKSALPTKDVSSTNGHVDLARYRITSLMRRTPYGQLSLALDTQQQRPVAIRDITIQQIDVSRRPHIFEALQQEYDLLRQQHIDSVLPLAASFHTEDHLYSISAWPLTDFYQKSKNGQSPRIYTLQDILQSGIGLPDEQITLHWILRLANAVEQLHRNNIVVGTLDPSTILINQKDYSGQPALFASWMPSGAQSLIQQALNTANASHVSLTNAARTPFLAPEAKQGQLEISSDIYSLGAILYLLVTGIAPTEQSMTASQPLRSPREVNSRVQNTLATTILKALARDPSARFQSIHEFTTALLRQEEQSKVPQRLYNVLLGHNRSVEKAGIQPTEINFTSDKDNNKTEKGKEAHSHSETNDETVSITPIQNELARRYMSRVDTQRLGQERLNSVYEKPIMEDRHVAESHEVETRSIQKKTLPMPEHASKEDQMQILFPVSIASNRKNIITEAPQQMTQPVEEETQKVNLKTQKPQQRQNESTATVLEIPSRPEEGVTLKTEPDNTHTDDEQKTDNARSLHDTDTTATDEAPDIQVERASNDTNEVPDSQIVEVATDTDKANEAHIAEVTTEQNEQKSDNDAVVPLDDQVQTQSILQPQQSSSTTAASTTIENPLSSGKKDTAVAPSPLPARVAQPDQDNQELAAPTKTFSSLLKRVRHFVLGGQPRTNNAVAIIETPMRIQPNKNYTVRIHIMGRNEPKRVFSSKQNSDNAALGGLGSLVHGDIVHIEVRSALYHNYAYIVQQTDVEVPAHNYAAEVTIPMRSITDSSGTRRERLHIFFTDEKHNPLYEKPFLIELFISNLVQSGHEGHNVLSIPL